MTDAHSELDINLEDDPYPYDETLDVYMRSAGWDSYRADIEAGRRGIDFMFNTWTRAGLTIQAIGHGQFELIAARHKTQRFSDCAAVIALASSLHL